MKVLRNHFGGKPTIFVNGRILNGCQNFKLEEAERVFDKYEVPEKYRKDVYDNYIETSTEEEILKFVDDEDPFVRREVALQWCGLCILINDQDWIVREAVASQGYGLDVLINDEDPFVREAVASQGYGLDTLINDRAWLVRKAVALQGYGLEVLIKDENRFVREAAKSMLNRS